MGGFAPALQPPGTAQPCGRLPPQLFWGFHPAPGERKTFVLKTGKCDCKTTTMGWGRSRSSSRFSFRNRLRVDSTFLERTRSAPHALSRRRQRAQELGTSSSSGLCGGAGKHGDTPVGSSLRVLRRARRSPARSGLSAGFCLFNTAQKQLRCSRHAARVRRALAVFIREAQAKQFLRKEPFEFTAVCKCHHPSGWK